MESFRLRLRKPSPAMIVALIALFVALSGGAAAGTYVAAKQLDARSTGVKQGNAQNLRLISARVAHLRARLFGQHKVQACCRGPRGPRGRRGPRGFRGPQGPAGPQGPKGITQISSPNGPVAHMCAFGGGACSVGSSVAICPTGTLPIGGAWAGDAPDPIFAATVSASFPYPSFAAPTGWGVIAVNNANVTASFHAAAICAS